jgi:membrane protease YdiL (CAAX protease family)
LTERSDALAFAAVLTVAAATLPNSFPLAAVWRGPLAGVPGLTWPVTRALALLTLGLALALPDPSRSGLTLGLRGLRSHWRGVLLVCGLPVLATAAVYPLLPERPFARAGAEMWLLSPVAQDLVFAGVLYGRLRAPFARPVLGRLRVPLALLVGAACFAAWHLPNLLGGMSATYLLFQLVYVALGYVLVGLARHWTGSLLYGTLTHSACNLIAWAAR